MSVQECATAGCVKDAAFTTRKKPAWCVDCIDGMFIAGGLIPRDPFTGKSAWRLTTCTDCQVDAHYRFEYVLTFEGRNERICRACFWREWSHGTYSGTSPVPLETAQQVAEEHGYDYLGALTDPPTRGGPHHVRCRRCQRLSAERLGDIGFGCTCSRNGKSAARSQAGQTPGARPRTLFAESDSRAVAWWDHNANNVHDWNTAATTATRTVNWLCPDCGYRFANTIRDMHHRPACPRCIEQQRKEWADEWARLQHTRVSDNPELLAAWADEEDPTQVMIGSSGLRRFRCVNGHHPRITPTSFLNRGCPSCRTHDARQQQKNPRLADASPEIAAQWHPDNNGQRTPRDLPHDSKRQVWWRDPRCGHEWQATVRERNKYQRWRCPQCETILDSLGYQYPSLAAEWSPNNPLTAWQVRPNTGSLTFTPEWICSVDPTHRWRATPTSRTSGAECPDCRQAGKSRIELDHHAAAQRIFGAARSGQSLRAKTFTRRPSWTVDITTTLPDGTLLAIEYDGAYWHTGKQEVDRDKTLDLLSAGHRIARLREHPLPSLNIADDHYLEVTVYATAPDPTTAVRRIADWALQGG